MMKLGRMMVVIAGMVAYCCTLIADPCTGKNRTNHVSLNPELHHDRSEHRDRVDDIAARR